MSQSNTVCSLMDYAQNIYHEIHEIASMLLHTFCVDGAIPKNKSNWSRLEMSTPGLCQTAVLQTPVGSDWARNRPNCGVQRINAN